MTSKKKLVIGIVSGLAVLLLAFWGINRLFFADNSANYTGQGTMVGPDGQVIEEGGPVYTTYNVSNQDPVTVDASVKLSTDTAYFYEAAKGKVDSVLVKEGQKVKKGDVLFTYQNDTKETQYAIEDLKRENTKLYNQREALIEQLGKLTNQYYNYKGDQIAYYWGNDGKQTYYVVEEIGQSTSSSSASNASQGQASGEGAGASVGGADAESLKEQIRQVNSQIEETEIKLVRQMEGQSNKVTAQNDGVVMYNEDGLTSNSVPLVRVISEKISVVGSVSEYDYYVLAEDRAVSIYVPAEDRTLPGKIISYDKVPGYSGSVGRDGESGSANTASAGSTSNSTRFGFVVEPEQMIQPGFSAKVNITLPGFVIPGDAIVEENGKSYVYKYDGSRVHKEEVELIQQGLQKVVLRGISAGDQLVMMPYDLQDNQEISIMQPMAEGMEAETLKGE